jgi:histidinol-phosphate aminotransferase
MDKKIFSCGEQGLTVRPRRSLLNKDLHRPNPLFSKPRDTSLLWLDKNENLDPKMMDISRSILGKIDSISFASYPELGSLYHKLAFWVGVSPESLLMAPGSDGAIRLVFESFVEHGDSVVRTNPTFAMYQIYSQMFGAQEHLLDYSASEVGPVLDANTIIKMLYEVKPKLLCLPNPDSPTGTVISESVLSDILRACENTKTVFLIDEAYHPFYENSASVLLGQSKNLIIARTFAKAWAAAGLRIGYLIGNPEIIRLITKMRPMYEVGTVAVEFTNILLDHADEMMDSVERINQAKEYFAQEMAALGFKVLPSAGNFLNICFGDKAAIISKFLAGKVLYKSSFEHVALAGFSRFSIAPKDQMKSVVDLINQAINGSKCYE